MTMPADRSIGTAAEAERASANLNTIMDRLIETVEEETARMREGRLRDALALETQKQELAQRYAAESAQLKAVTANVARTLPPECPRWPVEPDLDTMTVIPLENYYGLTPRADRPEGLVKVSSAWLIEHSGIGKAFKLPRSRASVSTKHALALTNRGGANAAELSELARFIQSRVHSEFGLLLQPEPVLVGVEL